MLLCVANLFPAVAGIALDNSTIRTAVAEWLSNSAAAEAAYGHISTWQTGGVTDMSYLFCGCSWCGGCNAAAASFNENIGAWDTSGVTSLNGMFYYASVFNRDIGDWAVHSVRDMQYMFYKASSFDQDLGDWAVHSVTDMRNMFEDASAFNQDLGWCVDKDVELHEAFLETPCAFYSCGVQTMEEGTCAPTSAPTTSPAPTMTPAPTITPLAADDSTIRTAVAAWLSDSAAAEAAYGHISTWETGGVTDMSELFCVQYCVYSNLAAASFNEDIGAWDTSGVKTMYKMFSRASAFNRDIGAWDTSGVTAMHWMFYYASAFNQAASRDEGPVMAHRVSPRSFNNSRCDVPASNNSPQASAHLFSA